MSNLIAASSGPVGILLAIIAFVTMISILVAAHEFGHYLFARLFNMGVEEFAIGLGKPILFSFGKRRYVLPLDERRDAEMLAKEEGEIVKIESAETFEGGGEPREGKIIKTAHGKALEETTIFNIRAWPLGGFVRIKGMMAFEDSHEVNTIGGFYSKPAWQRLIVLFAGPLFSVLAGVIILVPLFMGIGIVKGSQSTILEAPAKGSAADRAGFKLNDQIVSMNGQPVSKFSQIILSVRDQAGKKITFGVLRDGKPLSLTAIPELEPTKSLVLDENLEPTGAVRQQAKLGIPIKQIKMKLGFGSALVESASTPFQVIKLLAGMVNKPAELKENVGGPIGIAAKTKEAADEGILSVVFLAAQLSISLGIFNLLPIYPLDGGQMVVAFIELFKRKRLSFRMQNAIAYVGVAAILVLVVSVVTLDVSRLLPGGKPSAVQKK